MTLRFVCVAAVLGFPALVGAQSQPVFSSEGLVCQPYLTCSGPSMCEQPGIPVCGVIATGAQVCVPSGQTRFNLICCGSNTDCVDDHSVQGECRTFQQPVGEDISVCIWDTTRNFSFCRQALNLNFSDIDKCLGEVQVSFPTLAQKLLAGDCDEDSVTNENDVCPCMAADVGNVGNGCPTILPDAGIADASVSDAAVVTDAATTTDSGARTDATTSTSQAEFGGAGGCDGCAARSEGTGNTPFAMLALVMLVLGRRQRNRARAARDANVRG